jgi:hypothetical protein
MKSTLQNHSVDTYYPLRKKNVTFESLSIIIGQTQMNYFVFYLGKLKINRNHVT